jgi:inorganic pyrophosphatase
VKFKLPQCKNRGNSSNVGRSRRIKLQFHPWHDLETGNDLPQHVNVVVEIPRGSRNKYELDKETGLFRFDRLLYSAVHYPGDYGFIPRTLADDGDPLDVLIMTTSPTFTGCIVEVRPIGVFDMQDRGEMDEKILAVPVRDPLYDEHASLDDVQPHFLLEVEHFFEIYKDLEGAQTKTMGWRDRAAAHDVIRDCVERYAGKFPKK